MPPNIWPDMLIGYLISIAIETPVLLVGLSARHSLGVRLFSGVWLTACTYPVLWLVLPQLIDPDNSTALYLAVGETFVPIAECALFWLAFGSREELWKKSMWQDLITITVANLASFGIGVWLQWMEWWPGIKEPGPASSLGSAFF
jgi:hypothetical protein